MSVSYCLGLRGRDHIVLEQAAQAGEAWRNHRWDSFTFVTPNWTIRLPGAAYDGDAPDGFMARDHIVAYFERYVTRYRLPVRYGVRVLAIEQKDEGYVVRTEGDVFATSNVVIATGTFQHPKIPSFSAGLPPEIQQLHSGEYRNPSAVTPGAVLVVGSGQSGSQIAEELYRSGRHVYLSVGSAGRVPRRYRGKDIVWWLYQVGFFDRVADSLPSPKARFAGNPQASGKDGGHTINLHQFARDGVTLLGHLQGAPGGKIVLAPDLKETLVKVDKFEADLLEMIDRHIEHHGMDVSGEDLPQLRDGYEAQDIRELNLKDAGITSVIWAMGYTFDFGLVKLPVLDEDGYPRQKRGVTEFPGLYFVGLHWLHTFKSGILLGVGEDAEFVASDIAARERRRPAEAGSRP